MVPVIRQAPEAFYFTLKAAWRRLLKNAGGAKHVLEAGITRGSESRLSEAAALNCMDRFAALDQVLDLEMECGTPIVTQALADLHGFDLVQREAAKPIGIHAHFNSIVTEVAELQTRMATAMSDGTITDQERAEIAKEAQDAANALQAMIAEFRAPGTIRAVK